MTSREGGAENVAADATRAAELPCPKSGISQWKHGPANEPHTCPFAEEIHNDHESLCECCDNCARECAYDI